jgi:hypothetical protein
MNFEETKFPFYNWQESYGDELQRELSQKWNFYKKRLNINEKIRTKIKSIRKSTKSNKIVLTTTKGQETNFDLVIIASGFGKKYFGNSFPHYFKDFWKSGAPHEYDLCCTGGKKKIFISGAGDSGLIEVFNFCFIGFRHHQITKFLPMADQSIFAEVNALEENTSSELDDWERDGENVSSSHIQFMLKGWIHPNNKKEAALIRKILKLYRALGGTIDRIATRAQIEVCKPLLLEWLYLRIGYELKVAYESIKIDDSYFESLDKLCRKNVSVTLNSLSETAYSSYSSPVNKLLFSILERKGLVKFKQGRAKIKNKTVQLDGLKSKTFDVVIQRHGPHKKKMFKSLYPRKATEKFLATQMFPEKLIQFYHDNNFFKKTKLRPDMVRVMMHEL